VLLMLRHLGDRWGHVTREGTVVPLPLSHEILGQLVGARRPTVTIAVRALVASGIIQRRPDGSWLLTKGAERAINAIARPHVVTRSLGERLLLYRLSVRNIDDGRALHAEAGQILTRRVAR
jgi:hypothetical protein